MFQHHDDWVLDDGTLTTQLPANVDDCVGGGFGNSQAEKPWAIFYMPYSKSRQTWFCPRDNTATSKNLATDIMQFNGGTQASGTACDVAPNGEECLAEQGNLTMWSYMLNSVFTHRSCRYALEGALNGFATESVLAGLENPNIILFSERNSEGLADSASDFAAIGQDDYDAWAGEAALVRWGSGSRPNEGWLKFDRHNGGANYVYFDGHVKFGRWSQIRTDHFPDHVVRYPLLNPPN